MKKNYLDQTYKKINDYLKENSYDVMVVTSYENCYYLSGVFLYYNALIIAKDREPVLLVKYIDRQLAQNTSFISDIRGYSPYPIENQGNIIIGAYAESIAQIISELGYSKGKICIADFWAVLRPYITLREELPEAQIIVAEPFLEEIRTVKLPHEIDMMKKSLELLETAFNSAADYIREGVSEAELAGVIAKNVWSNTGELWHAIIASGENSMLPHSKIGSRNLKEGDNVVIDLVSCYDSYYAGLTRTFTVGKPSVEKEELYNVLLETAEKVYSTVRPGMEIGMIARIALEFIESKGYSKNIRHAFGHAIGTFPHESPILNTSEKRKLQENMVFCFEPGIYIPDVGGFRLGDMVVMTDKGLRKLTGCCRKLNTRTV